MPDEKQKGLAGRTLDALRAVLEEVDDINGWRPTSLSPGGVVYDAARDIVDAPSADEDAAALDEAGARATSSPPAGDVPAARPELRPGEAAVFVDWERAFADLAERVDYPSALILGIILKHTHPAPVGLAARMREELVGFIHAFCAGLAADAPCEMWKEMRENDDDADAVAGEASNCDSARALLADATPAAVSALDQAAAENVKLREALGQLALAAKHLALAVPDRVLRSQLERAAKLANAAAS